MRTPAEVLAEELDRAGWYGETPDASACLSALRDAGYVVVASDELMADLALLAAFASNNTYAKQAGAIREKYRDREGAG